MLDFCPTFSFPFASFFQNSSPVDTSSNPTPKPPSQNNECCHHHTPPNSSPIQSPSDLTLSPDLLTQFKPSLVNHSTSSYQQPSLPHPLNKKEIGFYIGTLIISGVIGYTLLQLIPLHWNWQMVSATVLINWILVTVSLTPIFFKRPSNHPIETLHSKPLPPFSSPNSNLPISQQPTPSANVITSDDQSDDDDFFNNLPDCCSQNNHQNNPQAAEPSTLTSPPPIQTVTQSSEPGLTPSVTTSLLSEYKTQLPLSTRISLKLQPLKSLTDNKYWPIFILLGVITLLTLTRQLSSGGPWKATPILHNFMGFYLVLFGMVKLLTFKEFTKSFQKYDLIAQYSRFWAYLFPLLQITLGTLLLSKLSKIPMSAVTCATLPISTLGALSIHRALWNKWNTQCACAGKLSPQLTWWLSFNEEFGMLTMALPTLIGV